MGIILLLVTGCFASESYDKHMNLALNLLESDELESAEEFFRMALEDNPDDEVAPIYLKQTTELMLADEAFSTGKISDAKKYINSVITIKNGLGLLIQRAIELQEEINSLEKNYESHKNNLEKAEEYLIDKDFTKALNLLMEIVSDDLTHPFYEVLRKDVDNLKVKVNEAEEEEIAWLKAEEERILKEKEEKEEQKRIAREKSEQKRIEQEQVEKEIQGVGPFEGYWLRDTMACHITDTYFVCALAYSGFITFSDIIEVNLISDMQIELTFEEYGTNTYYLVNENTLELGDGIYHRVSAEAANAIYGGEYTLP